MSTKISASLILTTRELKYYQRFQSQTTTLPQKSRGRLPDAAEYAAFQSWLSKHDSGYFSDSPLADVACYIESASSNQAVEQPLARKADLCGHSLHPTHQLAKVERCPVCTIEMHMTYMSILTTTLESAGGLMKQRWAISEKDNPALQAWYAGKLALVHDLHDIERAAELEEEYDNSLNLAAASFGDVSQVKTAVKALGLYWGTFGCCTGDVTEPKRTNVTGRKVAFCPDTTFGPGRDPLYFWRKSPRYEPGKHSFDLDVDEEVVGTNKSDTQCVILPAAHLDWDGDEDEDDIGDMDTTDEDEDSDDELLDSPDEESDAGDDEVIEGAEFVLFEN